MSGRGAYYKQLYGGGRGRGRGRGGTGHPGDGPRGTKRPHSDSQPGPRSSEDLLRIARSLGGKSYPAYRDLQGAWDYLTFRLYVDYIQSDPYAPPSKLRVRVPHGVAGIPQALWSNKVRTVALCDYLTRQVCAALDGNLAGRGREQQRGGGWAGEKGGQVTVDRPGQQVLERTSVVLVPGGNNERGIELRCCVALPAQGRTILGDQAVQVFSSVIPALAQSLLYASHDATEISDFVDCIEDQEDLRKQVMAAGLVAFVPNGAILPQLGADTLLFDEDTCATNFLIRDRRMQRLIASDPIIPLAYKVRAMLEDHGCSSILVIGGCGDYCDVADLVLEMRNYQCFDITAAAKQVAQEIPSAVPEHEASEFGAVRRRLLQVRSLPSPDTKTSVRKRTAIDLGGETLDLSALVQLTHDSQTRAIAAALKHLHQTSASSTYLRDVLRDLDGVLDSRGLDAIVPPDRIDGFLARPRPLELGMAINRLVCLVYIPT